MIPVFILLAHLQDQAVAWPHDVPVADVVLPLLVRTGRACQRGIAIRTIQAVVDEVV